MARAQSDRFHPLYTAVRTRSRERRGRAQSGNPPRGHGINGNYNRAGYFNNTNPGKYGITLNLNHPKGRELLRRWCATPT